MIDLLISPVAPGVARACSADPFDSLVVHRIDLETSGLLVFGHMFISPPLYLTRLGWSPRSSMRTAFILARMFWTTDYCQPDLSRSRTFVVPTSQSF